MHVLDEADPVEVRRWLWHPFGTQYPAGYDIGANCGQSVPDMLARCTLVTCCEPSPDSYAVLAQRTAGEQRVFTWPVAISDHTGSLTLADIPGRPHDTGQLVTPGHQGMEWEPPDWDYVPLVTVPCRTVDDLVASDSFLPGPLIKVDTEGHEVQVLKGASRTLRRSRPDWLIEFHSLDNYRCCLQILKEAGYLVQTVRHPHYPRSSPMWLGHGWIQATPASSPRRTV